LELQWDEDIVADLELSYDVTDTFTFALGASNLFNQYPEKQLATTVGSIAAGTAGSDNNGIFPYAYIAPYGTSGRFIYVRAKFKI
jgi:iron complex outermembrane receptor protein